MHTPLMHTSFSVQNCPSSQAPNSLAGARTQVPLTQVPTLQASVMAAQSTAMVHGPGGASGLPASVPPALPALGAPPPPPVPPVSTETALAQAPPTARESTGRRASAVKPRRRASVYMHGLQRR